MSATETVVKERPILFSGPMVRAILEGRKTQTRRIIKSLGICSVEDTGVPKRPLWPGTEDQNGDWQWLDCPFGDEGERLWVRETWKATGLFGGEKPSRTQACGRFVYAASKELEKAGDTWFRWRPSIHMPRWASRITLEITSVRVERLNEISHHDAMQEGLIEWTDPPRVSSLHYGLSCADAWETNAPAAFKRLWESINGEGSWSANPWVWVVSFKKI